MTKGTYNIRNDNENENYQAQRDTSFRSCLCVMLVFLVLCVVVALSGVKWTKNEDKRNVKKDFELLEDGYIQKTIEQFEKIEYKTTTEIISRPTTFTKPDKTTRLIPYKTTRRLFTKKKNKITEPTVEVLQEKTTVVYLNTLNDIKDAEASTSDFAKESGFTENTNETELSYPITTESDVENTNSIIDNYTVNDLKMFTENTSEIELSHPLTTKRDVENTNSVINKYTVSDLKSFTENTSEIELSHPLTTESDVKNTNSIIDNYSISDFKMFTNLFTVLGNGSLFNNETFEDFVPSTESLVHSQEFSVGDLHSTLNTETNMYQSTEVERLEGETSSVNEYYYNNENNLDDFEVTLSSIYEKSEHERYFIQNNVHSSTESVSTGYTENVSAKDTEKAPPQTSTGIELYVRSPIHDSSQFVISKSKVANLEPVCNAPGCISASSRILTLMNHSATACEDFYEFACGGMQAQSADSDNWEMLSRQLARVKNTPSKYLKELSAFYESCLRHEQYFDYEERMKQVRELVSLVGNFDLDDNARVDFTNVFARLVLLQSMPLFDVGLDIDKQSNNYILQLTLPRENSLPSGVERWSALLENQIRCLSAQQYKIYESNLNLKFIYDSVVACRKNYDNYLNIVENAVKAHGFFLNLSDTEVAAKIKAKRSKVEDILKVFNILPERNDIIRNLTNKEYELYKISDLQKQYRFLKWKRFFTILSAHEVSDNTLIQVYFSDYFSKLFTTLENFSSNNLYSALLSIYVTDLYQNFVVPKDTNRREQFCLESSISLFHDAVSSLYLDSRSTKSIKENYDFLTGMFTVLKKQFKSSIENSNFLDNFDKKHSLNKIDKMHLVLNKIVTDKDRDELDVKYKNIDLKLNGFQKNFIRMLNFSRINIFGLEGKNVDEDNMFKYFVLPFGDKPVTFYAKEMIVVPNGIIENTQKKIPGYILTARIGFHLAKAIGKHFDPVGIKYGLSWGEDLKEKYDIMVGKTNVYLSDKRIASVDNYNVEFQVPTEFSTNQRIAENIAFRITTDVFDNFGKQDLLPWISFTYSKEKVFFLATAQEYCRKRDVLRETMEIYESNTLPSFLLIENIMSNSKMFSDISTFDCALGSGMNNNDDQKNQFPYIKIEDDYGENNEDNYGTK